MSMTETEQMDSGQETGGQPDDETLLGLIQNAAKAGQLRVHVTYRKARRVPGFRDAMIAEVGVWPVRIREWFLYVALAGMLVWTLINQEFDLKSMTTSVFGMEVDYGFLTFMVLLITVVLVGRKWVKPVNGPLLIHVALTDARRFADAWRAGALTMLVQGKGPGRMALSPKHDWREFVQRHFGPAGDETSANEGDEDVQS